MNETGIAVCRDLPCSSDVWAHTGADADAGLMTAPRPPCEADLDTRSFTRRFPVRELRAKGWRARVADHATERLSNPATAPGDRVQHDTVEYRRVSLQASCAGVWFPSSGSAILGRGQDMRESSAPLQLASLMGFRVTTRSPFRI